MKKLDCNIVQDLLPLFVEEIVNDPTKEAIEDHLLHCESCKKMKDRMLKDVTIAPKPIAAPKQIIFYVWLQRIWYLLCPFIGLLLVSFGWEYAVRVYQGLLLLFSVICIASQFFSACSYGFDMQQYALQKSAEERAQKKWGRFRIAPLGLCIPSILTVVAIELPHLLTYLTF